MNTLLKLFKYSAGMALGLLLLMPTAAHADLSPATVLAINTDTANKKLYVEVSYVGRPCLIYQLKFGLEILRDGNPFGGVDPNIARPFKVVTGAGDSVVWRIDGNDETNANKPSKGYITKVEGDDSGNNDTLMYDMQISGYRLEFDLATISGLDRLRPSDSINVCLKSQMKPIECKGCGTAGSDRMFSLNDIAADCPYDYQNKEDMVACYRRDSKVANWEGWIVDARDCKRYRTVQMPDGKWWMAQNLNFQGTDGNKLEFKKDLAAGLGSDFAPYNGIFYCPDSATVPIIDSLTANNGHAALRDTLSVGSLAACNTYGALYPFVTIMMKDGKSGTASSSSSDWMLPTLYDDSVNLVRGICPEGWLIPTDIHWGKMINMVEKSCEDTSKHYGCRLDGENAPGTGTFQKLAGDSIFHYNPCMHIRKRASTSYMYANAHSWYASVCAYKDLLSTNVGHYRELDTTPNYIMGDTTVYLQYNANLYNDRRLLTAPKRIHRYATIDNPVWSYYTPETAGTDKYGFSILPAGLKQYSNHPYYLLGEAAVFWTSTSNRQNPTLTNTNGGHAHQRYFLYNQLLNPIIPHAIGWYSAMPSRSSSLRCIAEAKK